MKEWQIKIIMEKRERGRGRPRLTFENTVSIKDTGGSTRKNHEDPPEGMYEEVDDTERGERGI